MFLTKMSQEKLLSEGGKQTKFLHACSFSLHLQLQTFEITNLLVKQASDERSIVKPLEVSKGQ